MIRSIVALCLLLTASVAVADSRVTSGAWTATVDVERPERLEISMHTSRHRHDGATFDRTEFTGLTTGQIESKVQIPVHFEMRREAGVLAFDGTFRAGSGAGQFTFAPNHEFVKTLHSLGVRLEDDEDETQQLFNLALFDVSSAFIRSMQAIGYRTTLQHYVEFRIFDVDPDYVREMGAVGFRDLPAEKLVETRIHGATPEYIRHMRASGNDLSLDDYIQSRIFQVTPEFAAEMKQAGYPDLDHDTLVQFKIHDVSTEFIQDLKQLGYTKIQADKLVEMKIHGVTPEFIRRVNKAGYSKVPIDKMVQMRIFDIDPEMVRALDDGTH